MAKPLCASGGQILLNPRRNLEKQLENLLHNQPVVPGTLCVSTGRSEPLSLAQGPGTATLLLSSFSHNPQCQDPSTW